MLKSNLIQSIGLAQQEHNDRNGPYTLLLIVGSQFIAPVLVYFWDVHVLVKNNFVIEIILTLVKISRPLLGEIENLQ